MAKVDRKRLGKLSRRKGHSFERWVSGKLRKVFPEARRQLEYQSAEANGVDLQNCGPYMIQCKRGKRYASLRCIQEPQLDPIDPGIPILVTKGDHCEPLVAMPFDHFLKLVKKSLRK